MTALAPELLDALAAARRPPGLPALRGAAALLGLLRAARPAARARSRPATGDGRRRVWSTDTEPDGILRKACGNRREAVCPPCAERYRQDAYHLIAAGLRGGKGVPDTVAEHPARVRHADRAELRARAHAPRSARTASRGAAGRGATRRSASTACGCPAARVHDEDDPCLGEPLCRECFDHAGAVVWNNALGELWRRTTIYLPRTLARRLGHDAEAAARARARRPTSRSPSTSAAGSCTCTP